VRIAGIGVGATGAVLLGASAYFGLRARAASGELGEDGRSAWDQDLYDEATGAQRNAFLCLGLGAGAVAGGAVLYFVLGREPPVSIGPGGVALRARF
jgi:hypothetical protein